MTSNHAAAAKLIRAELKRHGIKGSVRAKSYAGGSSVNIRLEGDVPPATKKAVEAFAGRFQYGHFDGMTDCYITSNIRNDLPQVSFVFVEVRYSDETRQAAWDWARSYWVGMEGAPTMAKDAYKFYCKGAHEYGDVLINRALSGADAEFWAARKPRVRAS